MVWSQSGRWEGWQVFRLKARRVLEIRSGQKQTSIGKGCVANHDKTFFFYCSGDVESQLVGGIIPTDFHIFQRGGYTINPINQTIRRHVSRTRSFMLSQFSLRMAFSIGVRSTLTSMLGSGGRSWKSNLPGSSSAVTPLPSKLEIRTIPRKRW